MNVRRLTLDFQGVSTGKLNVLNKICDEDVAAVIVFAEGKNKKNKMHIGFLVVFIIIIIVSFITISVFVTVFAEGKKQKKTNILIV